MPFQRARAQAERPPRSRAVKPSVGFGSLDFYSRIPSPKTHIFRCSGSSLDLLDNLLRLAPLSCPQVRWLSRTAACSPPPPFLTFLFVAAHSPLCLACYLRRSEALNNHFLMHPHPSQTTCAFMSNQPIRRNRTLELLTPSPSAKGLGSRFKPIYISFNQLNHHMFASSQVFCPNRTLGVISPPHRHLPILYVAENGL